jgi:hypothetical protein
VLGSLEFLGPFEPPGWKPADTPVPLAYISWSLCCWRLVSACWSPPDSAPTRSAVLIASGSGREGHRVESLSEAFPSGSRGPAWETGLDARPWGFRLEDIRTSVYLSHGEQDANAPVAMGRYLATVIPERRATFHLDVWIRRVAAQAQLEGVSITSADVIRLALTRLKEQLSEGDLRAELVAHVLKEVEQYPGRATGGCRNDIWRPRACFSDRW